MSKLVRMTLAEALAKPLPADWLNRKWPTDEEIEAAAIADPDAQLSTEEELARAVWVQPEGTVAINLRVPSAVVAAYKALGKGWQTRMNDVLKASAPLRAPRFSHRQFMALGSYVSASAQVPWGRAGLDLGASRATKIQAKLQKILDGGRHRFSRDDLEFTSELGESLIEVNTRRLSGPRTTSKIREDAEWFTSVGNDIKGLASAMRAQIDGVLEKAG